MTTSICSEKQYSCGEKKKAVTSWWSDNTYKQFADRKFTLTAGGVSIDINKRNRDYSYVHHDKTIRTGFKYVISSGNTFDCYSENRDIGGTITEDYTTTDCTFHFVDLRNDLVVYTENTQHMEFSRVQSGGVTSPLDQDAYKYGTYVSLATGYDDAWLVPFIIEDAPITITNKIICTGIGTLHEETIDSGYWNGIRVLMPLFNGGSPRAYQINIDGVTYDAADVDWYYLLNHYLADGDQFFWWADWHKAVGVNNEIDAEEAIRMADIYTPAGKRSSTNGISTTDFLGSVAVDANGNIFFSAAFNTQDGFITRNKLVVGGTEHAIPNEKISIKNPDGSYIKKDSEYSCYYPIAPL